MMLKVIQLLNIFRIAGFISLRRLPKMVGLPKPFQDCRLRRLPKMVGLPKPFQDCRLRRLPKMVGLPKPFQQNAAHFVGFFASHLFTKASF